MGEKFYLLSGVVKNAGDFLITERCCQLIKEVYPKCEITLQKRNCSLEDKIDEMNKHDAVVFSGGPMYKKDMYPVSIKFVQNLDDIKVKICEIGLGWWAKKYNFSDMYSFMFEPKMRSLLDRIYQEQHVLSARDYYSSLILKNNGYSSIMTGCPAWYATEYVTGNRVGSANEVRKICVSDSVWYKNHEHIIHLIHFLKKKYKNAEIYFIFHRGIKADDYTSEEVAEKNEALLDELKKYDVYIKDISYGTDGFHIYDDCNLHIGYRVHAHIYNLSIHNISVLLQEDSRGAGVNQALGLFPLSVRTEGFDGEYTPYLFEMLERLLDFYMDENYSSFEQVFMNIEMSKRKMLTHIKNILN